MKDARNNKIFVTKPSLPKFQEVEPLFKAIWESGQLTNNGPMLQKLEEELCNYLQVGSISVVANGTLALDIAIKSLQLSGEVITTPFTFVATTHALINNSLKPVFCDTEKGGFNIDSNKIEPLITEQTSAILPVHCYGLPCNLERIERIAQKYDLKVIYDASHAFGTTHTSFNIFNFDAVSTLSFHATKVFNTIEGGAVISPNNEIKEKVDLLRNFGFTGTESVKSFGSNAKMSELHAALGIVQLRTIDQQILARKDVAKLYFQNLSGLNFIDIPVVPHELTWNFSYYPILVNGSEGARDQLYKKLLDNDIFARKYFYPLITDFECYQAMGFSCSHPNASDIANRILCLPIYDTLTASEIERISSIICRNSA